MDVLTGKARLNYVQRITENLTCFLLKIFTGNLGCRKSEVILHPG